LDGRSDIFSLGVAAYELATGQRPFDGTSVGAVFDAILHHTPAPPSAVQPQLGGELDGLVLRALEKDRELRFQTAGDLASSCKRILRDSSLGSAAVVPHAQAAAASAPPRSRFGAMGWAVAAVLAAALGLMLWAPWRAGPEPRIVIRQAIRLPASAYHPALSRDGTRLVYTQVSGAAPQIRLRMMDQLEANPIPGAESGAAVGFSPDGQWIVYAAKRELNKIPGTGGTPVPICDLPPRLGGATWASDDTIILADSTGLMRVPAAGGTPQLLLASNPSDFSTPQLLPDGKSVLYTISKGSGSDSGSIAVLDLKTRMHRVLVNSGLYAQYAPTGLPVRRSPWRRASTNLASPIPHYWFSLEG
jgi:hypothetical protein